MTDIRLILGDRTNTSSARLIDSKKCNATLKRKAKVDPSQRPLKFQRLQKQDSENIDPNEPAIHPEELPTPPIASTSYFRPPKTPLTGPKLLRQVASSARVNSRYATELNSTRPYLRAFVSSRIADVYKIIPTDDSPSFALPTSCSFSHAAKAGKSHLLAITTEHGSVELVNATGHDLIKHGATQQTSITVSSHIVFDVRWRTDDSLLAAVSADKSVHLVDPCCGKQVLRLDGHVGSIRAITWDPNHRDLLSTASRSGDIIHWDLRVGATGVIGDTHNLQAGDIVMDYESSRVNGRRSAKSAVRSITSLLHLPMQPFHIVSGGSTNGILRKWDSRMAGQKRQTKSIGPSGLVEESSDDPTLIGSKRARGISSLALNNEFIYGLGCDSRIHTYPVDLSSQFPRGKNHFKSDIGMNTSTFYSRLSGSPCGRFGAVGSTDGSVFLFDLASQRPDSQCAVRLKGHTKEIGGVDWGYECLASCSDDRMIRIWRYNEEIYRACEEDPEANSWHWLWA